jgi:hypothetical protein
MSILKKVIQLLKRAVSWGWSVDPPGCARRNELDSDSLCDHVALVSDNVYVAAAVIDKSHSRCVHVGLAVRIVAFISGHRSGRYGNQAMTRMRVPACASSWLPHIVLHE